MCTVGAFTLWHTLRSQDRVKHHMKRIWLTFSKYLFCKIRRHEWFENLFFFCFIMRTLFKVVRELKPECNWILSHTRAVICYIKFRLICTSDRTWQSLDVLLLLLFFFFWGGYMYLQNLIFNRSTTCFHQPLVAMNIRQSYNQLACSSIDLRWLHSIRGNLS